MDSAGLDSFGESSQAYRLDSDVSGALLALAGYESGMETVEESVSGMSITRRCRGNRKSCRGPCRICRGKLGIELSACFFVLSGYNHALFLNSEENLW